jgi:hypothetical protein
VVLVEARALSPWSWSIMTSGYLARFACRRASRTSSAG